MADEKVMVYRHCYCSSCGDMVGTRPEGDPPPAICCVRCQDLDRRFAHLDEKLSRLLAHMEKLMKPTRA